MKISKIAHGIAATAGGLGLLAIPAAWLAGKSGTFLGLSQAHLYSDAMVLLLAATAFGIATMVHQNMERNQ